MARYTGPEGAHLAPPSAPTSSRTKRVARRSSVAPSRPASTAAPVAATPAASTSPRCRRSRRRSTSTACSSGSSTRPTRRPCVSRARPVRTCCVCSNSVSTTSSTAPAGPRTRPQARQFVNHGLIQVDGKRVDIASFRVQEGRGHLAVAEGAEDDRDPAQHRHPRPLARRLARGGRRRQAVTVRSLPEREHIDVPVRESLIVELYSK